MVAAGFAVEFRQGDDGGDAGLAGAGEGLGVGLVRCDKGDGGVDVAACDALEEGLQVAAVATAQDGDAEHVGRWQVVAADK